MKLLISLLFYVLLGAQLIAQDIPKGKIVVQRFLSKSIQGNIGGEDPMRRVTIYLPPGYSDSKNVYPVIYFLHGFLIDDSLMLMYGQLDKLMDAAIASGKIKPTIMVLPNSDTRYKGSFYTNSTFTGNWADYIAKDLVEYVDKNFRTIPKRDSRGLAGHSMGGNGALKLGMLFPDVFGAVYSLSPAVLNWSHEFSLESPAFKTIQSFKNESEAFKILQAKGMDEEGVKQFYVLVMTNLARIYSPNKGAPPFDADFPVSYKGDSMIINDKVVKKWEMNFPFNMIEPNLSSLKKLNALKIDWGRNEENLHIPVTSLQFSKKLESLGIDHFAEEYIGTHTDKIAGKTGRVYTAMLPFFDAYLKYK